jgi:hypothetical protein
MSIAEIDAHWGEDLLENYSTNRTIILEKTEQQKLFEKWLSQT